MDDASKAEIDSLIRRVAELEAELLRRDALLNEVEQRKMLTLPDCRLAVSEAHQ